MKLGERLREERQRLGLTQAALAALMGTSPPTIISWEQGKTAPHGFQIAQLATAAHIDVLYLFTGKKDEAALSAEESELIDRFRAAPFILKGAIMGALYGAERANKTGLLLPNTAPAHAIFDAENHVNDTNKDNNDPPENDTSS